MRVVVVGAGIAALAASVRLAASGCAVTVLEKASEAGGKLDTVEIDDRQIDVGPTVLTMRDVFDELFALGGEALDDHLKLEPCETIARHVFPDGGILDLHADPERSAGAVAAFSGEASARDYRAFLLRAKEVHDTLSPIFMQAERPSGPLALVARAGASGLPAMLRIGAQTPYWKALERSFRDPRLRQLFGRYATYNGSSPFEAPATLMLIAHVEAMGVFLVKDGMAELAAAIRRLAMRLGVLFRFDEKVAAITADGYCATGVTLANGEVIEADAVLSNADVGALAKGRFGRPAQKAVATPLALGERSLSALTIALVAETAGLPLMHHNVFFSRDYRREFEMILRDRRLPDDPTVYLCASDRDGRGQRPDGPERLFMIVNAPADGDERPFDRREVDQCVTAVFSRLRASGLQVAVRPDSMRLSTPSDFAKRFPGTGGALYGRASHGPMASFRRPAARTKLPGLYLCGGSVHPGAGLPMAALSGKLAAQAILADLASTSRFRPAAMPGGTSTRFRPTAASA